MTALTELTELIGALVERAARRSRTHWLLSVLMAACGAGAQLWLSFGAGAGAWTAPGLVAVAVGVVFARSVAPLLTGLVLVVEAATSDLSVAAMVPLAVLLLGWHVCATLLSTGRPWTRLAPGVVAAYRPIVTLALSATLVTAGAAWAVSGLQLSAAPALTLLGVLGLVLAAVALLWVRDAPPPR